MTFSKIDIVLPNEIKEYYANTPEEKQAELHADFKQAINAAKIHFEKVRKSSQCNLYFVLKGKKLYSSVSWISSVSILQLYAIGLGCPESIIMWPFNASKSSDASRDAL